ncbi:hypothetical protein BDF19DRAFT_412797 [Syncephalis fuscata]|nr:hypothetical protein BDF19DRAFT_412797 [Syncephalis fuscata]
MSSLSISPTERALVIAVSIGIFTVDFVAFSYIWYFRTYPPLKAKHIPLMGLCLLSSFLWWLGTMHANGLFGFQGVWSICSVWMASAIVWLQFCFGVMLLMAILIYRLYTLRNIFTGQRITSNRPSLAPILFYLIPVMSMGVVASVFPEISVAISDKGSCRFNTLYKAVCFSWVGLAAILLCYLSWSLRNIRKTFNEFKELRAGCMATISCLIWNAAILMLRYHTETWGFYLVLVMDIVTFNFFYWLVLAKPFYGHVFNREECLDKFLMGLVHDTDTTLRWATTPRTRATTAVNSTSPLEPSKATKTTDSHHHPSPV